MKIYVITLFPEVIEPYFRSSIMKRAAECGAVEFLTVPLREFGLGRHKQVDDAPYGGGAGMLMRPEPIFAAVESITKTHGTKPRTILLAPQGVRFTQQEAQRLSHHESLLFICGHYEGIDDRIRQGIADEEISIGDYVLTGGELGALVIVDAVVRLLDGVLSPESTVTESFTNGLLEFPQFTRPPEFRGMKVPEVLMNGNHAVIEKWRKENALRRTELRSKSPNLSEETHHGLGNEH